MMVELIILISSALIVFLIYLGRFISRDKPSIFFSNDFLVKMDESLFVFIMFVFKLYSLVVSNISHFFKELPHVIADSVHKISHAIAAWSHTWIEKLKPRHDDKEQ